MLRPTLLFSLILFVITPHLYSQDAPSLGDLARHVRAEKSKQSAAEPSTAQPASRSTQPAPSDAAAPPSRIEVAPTQANVPGRISDATLHENDIYEDGIRSLFNGENFDKLDEIADRARATKARLTGGYWAIHLFYDALQFPAHMGNSTESEWKLQLDRLQRWTTQKPQSITARVALAGAWLQYAWNAPGDPDETDEQRAQLFNDRLDTSAKVLADAFNLPVKDPEWFLAMYFVLRSKDRNEQTLTAMFEKAIAFEPDYQYYYRVHADTFMPKWGGEIGEMAVFANQIADRIGGTKGDLMYYEIAAWVNCACDERNQTNGMSWPRIKRGYIALEKQYGASLIRMNQMAKFAGLAGDPDYANEIFTRIGENWDPHAWGKRENFEMVREWAGFSQIEKSRNQGLKQVDANLKTPEGRRFNGEMEKAFQSSYTKILESCRVLADETKPTPFDLILRIGRTGLVEDVFFSVATRVSVCVSTRVASGRFPNPPEPSYWTRISVH